MTEIQISAIAVVITILASTWKMSSLIGQLTASFAILTRTVDKLTTKMDDHSNTISRHDEQIKHLEQYHRDDAA
jgi:hypothetical protein